MTKVEKINPFAEDLDKPNQKTIIAYKGFDQNMQCRGFQFEVGKAYEHEGEVKVCDAGFHACENPLDVLDYYPLDSRFAIVKASGQISRDGNKIAAASVMIEAELKLPDFIAASINYIKAACNFASKPVDAASGDSSKLAASGDYSKLAASGKSSIAISAGIESRAKAGELGCIVLTRWVESEKRNRVSVGYVGEGLKADTWYELDDAGNFVEAV